MPETKITCPQCGYETESSVTICPACGQPLAKPGVLGRLQPVIGAVLATMRTHRWYWVGGGGVVLAAAAAAVVVFGGFLGPSGKAVCTATLATAKDYGVIPMSAELASNSAESTNVEHRRKCTASVGNDTFNLLTDIKCNDMKKSDCLALYSVARSDGLTTYQVREIPPDETDEAIEAAEKQAAETQEGGSPAEPGGLGTSSGGSDSGIIDTETTVEPPSGIQSNGQAQPAPQQ